MNAKDKGEANNQAIVIEDLSVRDAETIKGGLQYELKNCLISSYAIGG